MASAKTQDINFEKQNDVPKVTTKIEDGFLVCGKCGTKNTSDRKSCWKCNELFDQQTVENNE